MSVESSIAAQLCVRVVLLCFLSRGSGLVFSISWFGSRALHGRPAFSFIGQGKARVTAEEKEKNEREEGF